MIAELDRYQGVVLRQIIVTHREPIRIGVAGVAGRTDAFCIHGAAFHVKHCSKRLSPWGFTYLSENLADFVQLRRTFDPVWAFLVCGQDGVVGLSAEELMSIAQVGNGGAAWVRISRRRNSMYRVGGGLGELRRAKRRGVHGFLDALFGGSSEAEGE